jgi:hypothetical protein
VITALSFGFGVLTLSEYSDSSIRTDRELAGSMGQPVLGCIPYVENEKEKSAKKIALTIKLLIAAGMVGALIWAIMHYNLTYQIPKSM